MAIVCGGLLPISWHPPKGRHQPLSIMMGHRLMGMSLLCTGEIGEGRTHLNRALALYDPVVHRPLAVRFGQDIRMAAFVLSIKWPVDAWLS
jgi:hypothetical protein